MRRVSALLICFVAIFAAVSCKNDPEPSPTPAPKADLTDNDVLEGRACYRLTATREAKRFALQYYDEAEGTFNAGDDDVLTLKYRSEHPVDRFYLRDTSQKAYLPGGSSYHEILASDDPYVAGPDEDGWYTLTYTFSEMTDPVFGIRIELANYNTGKFVAGDYLEIKDLAFNGEKLTIEEDEETEAQQSNHGVWNNTNTDHTLPTLDIVSL